MPSKCARSQRKRSHTICSIAGPFLHVALAGVGLRFDAIEKLPSNKKKIFFLLLKKGASADEKVAHSAHPHSCMRE